MARNIVRSPNADLNDASLTFSRIRAIADLVAQADRDALFDDAIELASEGKQIVETSQRTASSKRLEVVNG